MFDILTTGFINIRLLDIIDIILVAILLYQIYNLLKGTSAINIFIGILALILIWRLVSALEMELLSKILGGFISVGFIALIIVFQPEIRRFLLLLGTANVINQLQSTLFFGKIKLSETQKLSIDPIVNACEEMSKTNTGALIILTKKNKLQQLIDTGEKIESLISGVLIENIFYKNSPLHDGAIIIHKNKIRAARCVLPITKNENFPPDYGLRHRAAAGVSEQSDAIAIIVSEQTGKISYAKGGSLHIHLTPVQLKKFLLDEYKE
ncbi:MAG: diadenylate cyclase CdaA [Bacteroidota bacterium]|nr:diadenylate cyclase CdaA [Bacteroidota bacterium]